MNEIRIATITITTHFACFFDIFFSKSVGLLSKPLYIIVYDLFSFSKSAGRTISTKNIPQQNNASTQF